MSSIVFQEDYEDYAEKFYHQCQAMTNDGTRCKNRTAENYCKGVHAASRESEYGIKKGFARYMGATRYNWTRVFEKKNVVPYTRKEYDEYQACWLRRLERAESRSEKTRRLETAWNKRQERRADEASSAEEPAPFGSSSEFSSGFEDGSEFLPSFEA